MPIPFTAVPEFGDGLLQPTTSRSFLSRNTNGTVGLFDASSILAGTGTVNRVAKFTGAGLLGNTIATDDGSVFTIEGRLTIGSGNIAFSSIVANRTIIAPAVEYFNLIPTLDVATTTYTGIRSFATIPASGVMGGFTHFSANGVSLGSGASITTQVGFRATSTMTQGVDNYGFQGVIPDGAGRWNLYMNGSAPNFLQGRLGIGSTLLSDRVLSISGNLSSTSNTAHGIVVGGVVTGDNIIEAFGVRTISQFNTGATLTSYFHYAATQGATLGRSVNAQMGFLASSNLTHAANNYGFRGLLTSATGRWNIYMDGSAPNYLAGKLFINTLTDSGELLIVNGTARIATIDNGVGDFLTTTAAGRITRRTATQLLGDIGAWSVSGNAPSTDTTFIGTTNARPFDIRVNNSIIGNFSVGGAVNFGSPSSSSSVLNIGGGASIFAQGSITAPGITEDAAVATNYLTLGGSNIIRRRSITQVRSDLGIFDSIHNQNAVYQSANFRISGTGRYGTDSGYSQLSASSLFSNQNFSIRTPRLYISNNDIPSDLSGLSWRAIIDSGSVNGEGLYIKGRILATNNVSASSDARLKSKITRLHNSDILSLIEGKDYIFGGRKTAGFIAQDVMKHIPHLVSKEKNGYYSLDYVGFIPYIVEFIKSDRERINELEREVDRLKFALRNVT